MKVKETSIFFSLEARLFLLHLRPIWAPQSGLFCVQNVCVSMRKDQNAIDKWQFLAPGDADSNIIQKLILLTLTHFHRKFLFWCCCKPFVNRFDCWFEYVHTVVCVHTAIHCRTHILMWIHAEHTNANLAFDTKIRLTRCHINSIGKMIRKRHEFVVKTIRICLQWKMNEKPKIIIIYFGFCLPLACFFFFFCRLQAMYACTSTTYNIRIELSFPRLLWLHVFFFIHICVIQTFSYSQTANTCANDGCIVYTCVCRVTKMIENRDERTNVRNVNANKNGIF